MPGQNSALPSDQRTTTKWFNTGAFISPPAYQFGSVGRNTVTGLGMVNLDTTIARNFRLWERLSMQLREEFFNIANHLNYNIVGRIINQPNFGGLLSQFDPREVQVAAKFIF
jgi:hypothetical protein